MKHIAATATAPSGLLLLLLLCTLVLLATEAAAAAEAEPSSPLLLRKGRRARELTAPAPALPDCANGYGAIRVPDVEPIGTYTNDEYNAAHGLSEFVTITNPGAEGDEGGGDGPGFEVKDDPDNELISADGFPVGTVTLGWPWQNIPAIGATFAEPVSEVWVDVGDRNADEETIYLDAYDEHGGVVGGDSFVNPWESFAFHRLTVAAPPAAKGIKYITIRSTGNFPNSIYFDKLTFCEMGCQGGSCGK